MLRDVPPSTRNHFEFSEKEIIVDKTTTNYDDRIILGTIFDDRCMKYIYFCKYKCIRICQRRISYSFFFCYEIELNVVIMLKKNILDKAPIRNFMYHKKKTSFGVFCRINKLGFEVQIRLTAQYTTNVSPPTSLIHTMKL